MSARTINHAYEEAINVLKLNITEIGFSASPERVTNYYSVWSRDHSITSIAACLTNDKDLIDTAKKGTLLLLRKQIDHGQVPSYVEIENRNKVYGGLGSITSVDSNMWVVIAAAFLYKRTKDRRFVSNANLERYKKLYRLLKAFDSNDCGFIEVPEAGDWQDVFDTTYHVLYDECLYYQAMKALQFLFEQGLGKGVSPELQKDIKKRINWIKKRKPRTKRKINDFLWLTKENIKKIKEEYLIYTRIPFKNYDYYQSHLVPFKLNWHDRFDSFGNILAMVFNIADSSRKTKICKYVIDNEINKPVPIKSLSPPVFKHEKDWQPIYAFKEKPYTYHNGGIWPVIAGFWIYALSKKHPRIAMDELDIFAKTLKKHKWRFSEYMNGKTGRPMGKSKQAWSAAGYVIAYRSANESINLFDYK